MYNAQLNCLKNHLNTLNGDNNSKMHFQALAIQHKDPVCECVCVCTVCAACACTCVTFKLENVENM